MSVAEKKINAFEKRSCEISFRFWRKVKTGKDIIV